jgi:hypothetical protein
MGDFPHRDCITPYWPLYVIKIHNGTGKSIHLTTSFRGFEKIKPVIRTGTRFMALCEPLLLLQNKLSPHNLLKNDTQNAIDLWICRRCSSVHSRDRFGRNFEHAVRTASWKTACLLDQRGNVFSGGGGSTSIGRPTPRVCSLA